MSTEEIVKTPAPAKKKAAAKTAKPKAVKAAGAEAAARAPKAPRATKAKAKPAEAEVKAISVPTHEEIALLAMQYWIERGYEHGKAEQDWFRAEQELRGMAS